MKIRVAIVVVIIGVVGIAVVFPLLWRVASDKKVYASVEMALRNYRDTGRLEYQGYISVKDFTIDVDAKNIDVNGFVIDGSGRRLYARYDKTVMSIYPK